MLLLPLELLSRSSPSPDRCPAGIRSVCNTFSAACSCMAACRSRIGVNSSNGSGSSRPRMRLAGLVDAKPRPVCRMRRTKYRSIGPAPHPPGIPTPSGMSGAWHRRVFPTLPGPGRVAYCWRNKSVLFDTSNVRGRQRFLRWAKCEPRV